VEILQGTKLLEWIFDSLKVRAVEILQGTKPALCFHDLH